MAWPIAPKQDDPQRLIALNGVPIKFWLSAEEINEVIKRLSALLGEETSLFKGEFDFMEELEAEHPLPEPGSTAHLRVVNGDDIFCRWDNTDKKWIQAGLVKDNQPGVISVAENIRAVLQATGTKYYGTKDGVAGVWAFPEGSGGGSEPIETADGFKVINFQNGYQGGLTWKPYSSFEFEGTPHTASATLTATTNDIPAGEKKFAALVLNSNGTITLVQGQPAVNPSAPNINSATQLIPDGGLILLSAGATAPEGITLQKIYTNNSGIAGGEADASIFRGGARWNLASNEGDGICIKGTNLQADDRIDFIFESPVPIANFTELTFKMTNLTDTGLPVGSGGGFRFFIRGSVMVRNKLSTSTILLPSFEKSGYDVTNIGGEQFISIKVPAVNLLDVINLGFVFDHGDPAVVPTILLDDIKYNDGSAPSGENFATVGFVERVIAELRAYIVQQDLDLESVLANKVDKVEGYGLSQENYSPQEKAKVAGLEGPKWKGTFLNRTALETAYPVGEEGWSADIDAGAGAYAKRYIWDIQEGWVASTGEIAGETAESIATKYHGNEGIEAFTTTLLNKLNSITEVFTTALKNTYDTAATWVSTNGQNVLDHITKWATPATAGKMPRTLADGSIEWIDEPTGGDGTGDATNLAKLDATNTYTANQKIRQIWLQYVSGTNPFVSRIWADANSNSLGWKSELRLGAKGNGTVDDIITLYSRANSVPAYVVIHRNTTINGSLEITGSLIQSAVNLTRNSADILTFDKHGSGTAGASGYIRTSNPETTTYLDYLVRNGAGSGWSSGHRFFTQNGSVSKLSLTAAIGGDNTITVTIEENLIVNGRLKMNSLDLSGLGEYADDAAAAFGGVPVGYAYVNSATGAVHKRRS